MKNCLIIAFLLFSVTMFAQDPSMIPPTQSAMLKSSDIIVNYRKGIPLIDIPLYEFS